MTTSKVGPFKIRLTELAIPIVRCDLTVDQGINSASIIYHDLPVSNVISYPNIGFGVQYDFTVTNNTPDLVETLRYVATTYDAQGKVVNVSTYISYNQTFVSGTNTQRGVNVGSDPYATFTIRAEGQVP